jgi:hypothetical protein
MCDLVIFFLESLFKPMGVLSDPLPQPMVAVASSKTPYSVREFLEPKSVSMRFWRGPEDSLRATPVEP